MSDVSVRELGDNSEDNIYDEIKTSEKGYSTSEFASKTGISPSTLRRYSLDLESHGYFVYTNSNNHRVYMKHDIAAFKALKKLFDAKKTADEAYAEVASKYPDYRKRPTEGSLEDNDLIVFSKKEFEALITGFHEQTKQAVQEAAVEAAKLAVSENQKLLNESLERRDELLMKGLKNTLETQRQLAATQEEESKKGFWNRLFGK